MTMQGDSDAEVDELLLPPDIVPDAVRPQAGARMVRLEGETMGTTWSLGAAILPDMSEDGLRAMLERGFARVIAQMSQWEPGSELSRFNRAPPGTRFPISPEFAYVLDCALGVARASEGAFDPTLGGVSDLWGFGAVDAPAHKPLGEQAVRVRGRDWRDIEMADDELALVQPGGLRLDLSGIAKGFAVDLGMRWLRTLGVKHALLEVGGELCGIGVQADGMPWWVDIDIPPGSNAPHARIALTGWAAATSGNYRRRREADGQSWSHSLDPKNGVPLGDQVLAATVLHPGCMQADALATVLMVLGADKGMMFADAHGLPARIVTPEGTAVSTAWAAWAEEAPQRG